MSVNKVILVGNVGKDPDVRYLDNNAKVANFTLATTERGYTLQNGTQVPDRTEWHNIVVWRGLADVVEKYVRKGTQLYIEGKIRTRSYDDKTGAKRYVTEIFADDLQMLGRKSDVSNGDYVPQASVSTQQQSGQQRYNQPTYQSPAISAEPYDNSPVDNGDDLPF